MESRFVLAVLLFWTISSGVGASPLDAFDPDSPDHFPHLEESRRTEPDAFDKTLVVLITGISGDRNKRYFQQAQTILDRFYGDLSSRSVILRPRTNDSIHQQAEFVADQLLPLMDAYPQHQVVVLGHSKGGLAAYEFAVAHSERVVEQGVRFVFLQAPFDGTKAADRVLQGKRLGLYPREMKWGLYLRSLVTEWGLQMIRPGLRDLTERGARKWLSEVTSTNGEPDAHLAARMTFLGSRVSLDPAAALPPGSFFGACARRFKEANDGLVPVRSMVPPSAARRMIRIEGSHGYFAMSRQGQKSLASYLISLARR